jgi:hypothetical protein
MANKPASPTGFTNLLADVKQRIQSAQTRSMLAVNSKPEPESPPMAEVPQPVAQLPDTFLWANLEGLGYGG